MLRKFLYTILIIHLVVASVPAQNTVKEMRRKAGDLQKQIEAKEKILQSSQKDVKSKLQNLELLTARIKERKELIDVLHGEVRLLDSDIAKLDKEVIENEKLVDKARGEYASALKRAKRYGSFQDKLLFIMSADDFNTMLRRYRYAKEYMNAHRDVAEKLKTYIAELEAKRAEADSVRAHKKESMQQQKVQQSELENLENEQRTILAQLRKESRKVEKELKRQRDQLAKLNKEIDRAIEREIEAQKARERAARAKKSKSDSKAAAKAKDEIKMNNEEIAEMSGSFVQNKGKLPVPITGPYHLVGNFGLQKGVVGKGNVKIDYGGITLQGAAGAQARCVFAGKVTSIVRSDDFAFVIVRHGSYLTVYCRLTNICVKEGDKVKAGDILGDVATDASGHTRILFQLRKEKMKLNPVQWLRM